MGMKKPPSEANSRRDAKQVSCAATGRRARQTDAGKEGQGNRSEADIACRRQPAGRAKRGKSRRRKGAGSRRRPWQPGERAGVRDSTAKLPEDPTRRRAGPTRRGSTPRRTDQPATPEGGAGPGAATEGSMEPPGNEPWSGRSPTRGTSPQRGDA